MEQRDHGTRDGTGPGDRAEGTQDGKLRSRIAQQVALASRAAGSVPADADADAETGPGPKGELYRNFGDGFTRAVELAITPVIFGALGYGLDRWLGTRPVFLTIFFLLSITGMLLRTWYGYAYRMQRLDDAAPWGKPATAPATPPATPAAADDLAGAGAPIEVAPR